MSQEVPEYRETPKKHREIHGIESFDRGLLFTNNEGVSEVKEYLEAALNKPIGFYGRQIYERY